MQSICNTLLDDVREQSTELLSIHLAAAIDLHSTVQVAAERTFLAPYRLRASDEKRRLFAVATSLAAFGQSARAAIGAAAGFGDVATADLFTEVSRSVNRQLWFIEARAAPR